MDHSAGELFRDEEGPRATWLSVKSVSVSVWSVPLPAFWPQPSGASTLTGNRNKNPDDPSLPVDRTLAVLVLQYCVSCNSLADSTRDGFLGLYHSTRVNAGSILGVLPGNFIPASKYPGRRLCKTALEELGSLPPKKGGFSYVRSAPCARYNPLPLAVLTGRLNTVPCVLFRERLGMEIAGHRDLRPVARSRVLTDLPRGALGSLSVPYGHVVLPETTSMSLTCAQSLEYNTVRGGSH